MLDANLLIPILAFVSVLCLGGAVLSASVTYRRLLKSRLHGYKSPDRIDSNSNHSPVARFLGHVGKATGSKEKPKSSLRKELVRAGYHGQGTMAIYMGAKMLLLVVGLFVFGGIALFGDFGLRINALLVIGGVGFLFFLPNWYVAWRAQRRAGEIRRHLPDAIDLLEICVSGGMGLDQAWNSVADQIRSVSPMLADEMALTNLEMHLGGQRADAMRHMAERTGADELASLVAVLVQSERFGTSVADALRVFTQSMREQRSQKAEESAEKMAVKMLFPMIVLIFPVVLIVAVGPAGITLSNLFGGN